MQIHLKLVNRDSQVISFLRFPMIIGIVLIHSGIEMDYNFSEYVIYDMIVTKGIIGILSRVCVPLFFMISGYLFFYNVKLWNAQTYIYKL
jgi:surface polysaccharide O-acyltransferase-like enzyme